MFGIWGHEKAAEITYYALHALQHRGQDGAGIVTYENEEWMLHKDVGLLNDVFSRGQLERLSGRHAIGQIHYVHGANVGYDNVQPHLFQSQKDSLAIVHSGNITNAYELRGELERSGSIFQTESDTELLAHLIRRQGAHIDAHAIQTALENIVGAYAFLLMTQDCMYVALDPYGIRPLSIGKLHGAYVAASESCAFDLIGAEKMFEVQPGELIRIADDGIHRKTIQRVKKQQLCAMEYVYFSRPDSDLQYVNVHAARKRMGIQLAKEASVCADVVTGVPDSSISAAIGYAEASNLPYEIGLIKNRYVGRTFIKPSQELREQGVKMKLSPVKGIVAGKRVVMVDDSIVRGTTSKKIVTMLKEAGAAQVHVRIASPAVTNPCFYGIDMSTKQELFAANYTLEEMCDIIGADSLAYLSPEGLEKAIVATTNDSSKGICNACFTGNYPVAKESKMLQAKTAE
ncbi:amidophosphoribosyltransferase [Virgibacillus sp. 179-BFC.A HS]|uniref:Amidophosphoribosyltransferase n=1 Tax=Tigheibacillus jepli TaxID=3035914 RepID=A0ABU5CJU1_9BACI|nr:amidophosphoribosyltransferase [Virgibacillus sp. 179-BFC.A HS]MDY0406627.1 amidophosphoribosyltransferase [Virgibacillus sp. 179-BFC.A HS]